MNAKEIVSQGILQFIWAVSREKWRFKEGKNEKSLNYEIVSPNYLTDNYWARYKP